ncbi:hypothetical protein PTTG_26231 [Puccinia triticina 1-1 BBBD Race 1]|uniref:Uncharacterized protein n=1 Tax=Puccinia triticina (isolate 1-1 / race 1 (BBBD)) TaxID=630390 RepID=A0A180GVD5_PUCT1|nr:hypothetical protein PTTG_26231 [Puccinia triticina 1-1 BBBD Race 1]
MKRESYALQSPIPLYVVPGTRRPPFGLRKRLLAEHDQLKGVGGSASRVSRAANTGTERAGALVTPDGGLQYRQTS